jgi:hypothetical protein
MTQKMSSSAAGGSPASGASGNRPTYAEEKKFIEQLDDVRYSIKPGFVPGMVHCFLCG